MLGTWSVYRGRPLAFCKIPCVLRMASVLHVMLPFLAIATPGPVAVTPYGSVRGFVANSTNVWRGIRYAAPPVLDLRFRPPQPPTPWSVTLDTVDFGKSCTQWGSNGTQRQAAWLSLNLTNSGEDCLFVNVYAPVGATGPLPVMVYMHAGEFRFGSSNDLESSWPYFAHGSVILVTANYRLGFLGFAALDTLRSRDPSGSSGNYGMQDQRAAFQWVQRSIAAFGGNADKVTLFGESSGGSSIGFHLMSKASQGLFSQVILESPGLTQSKPWKDSSENTEVAVSALTAAGSPGCTWPAEASWKRYLGVLVKSKAQPLEVANKSVALRVCEVRPDCFLVYSENTSNVSMLYGGGTPGLLHNDLVKFVNESLWSPHPGIQMYLRLPNEHTSVQCLLNASVLDLVSLDETPLHDDTFLTDSVAPTVDGVELSVPLVQGSLNLDLVPKDVAVLAGSNMDEGTMFMYNVPDLECNATEQDFLAWSKLNWGPELGSKVPPLYEFVELPTPLCSGEDSVNTSIHWVAAMRSAGDSAILCNTRELLRRVQTKGSPVWWYYFTHMPIFSMNIGGFSQMKYYGAFHGAEVPFVFGDQFELESDAERALSGAMGCYWINFAATGNPNEGPSGCAAKLSLPKWPTFGNGDAIEFTTGQLRNRTNFKQAQCDLFTGSAGLKAQEIIFA